MFAYYKYKIDFYVLVLQAIFVALDDKTNQ